MKKILCVITLSTLLVGCTPTQNPNDIRPAGSEWWIEEFDGHSYVIRGGHGQGYGSGIAHNPKCICTSK